MTSIEDKNGHKICLHYTKNSPAQKTEHKENKLLVALFAWDGNSFPGNEYHIGKVSSSGDAAAASCSTIIDTYVGKFLIYDSFGNV